MLDILISAGAVYVSLNGALYLLQRRLVFVPLGAPGTPAEADVPDMRVVRYQTGDGLMLEGWYKPPAGRPTIVYFHGNAGHFGERAFKARYFMDRGYGFLLASYRGYAGNPGRPSEAGCYRDARAALDFLAREAVAPSDIVIYGESLGTGVATAMAHEYAAAALVLEAPFSSLVDVAARRYWWTPARWLLRDRFESARRIAAIDMPLLIFHGGRDRVVPLKFGKRLFTAALEPKELRILPAAGHADLYDFGAAEVIEEFLRHATAGGGEPVASRPRTAETQDFA
jgi:fermentation-respiration switch protein FrsA (DUF1100 family)